MWTRTQGFHYIKNYPFFDTIIREYNGQFEIKRTYETFKTLSDAKRSITNQLKKIKLIDRLPQNGIVRVEVIKEWPNNIGNGLYVHKYLQGEKYNWIEGMHQPWRSPCNWYSIRYDLSVKDIEDKAIKIVNSHIRKIQKKLTTNSL